jgi:hypothetical protein
MKRSLTFSAAWREVKSILDLFDAGLLTLEERNKSFEQIRIKLGLKRTG